MADLTVYVGLDAKGVQAGEGKVRRSIAGIRESFNGMSASMASFAGNVAAGAFQQLSSQIMAGAKALLDYSARMQQTQIAFTTLMGNAEAATKHLAELRKFAVDTPFEFESLAKMSQRLQSVGVSAQNVVPLMKDIGNVAAATGDISAERIGGITTAISQMISKTTVSAEEMEQLAERGVPAWKILAEATGKTQAEVRKLSEQGVITSDIMVEALQKISREKFGDAMEKQSKTFDGAMSTIRDVLMQTAATAFDPIFQKMTLLANELATEIQGKDFEQVGHAIADKIGKGFGMVVHDLAAEMGRELGDSMRGAGKKNLLDSLEEGFDQGFWRQVLGDAKASEFGIDISKSLLGPISKTSDHTKIMTDQLEKANSAVKKIGTSTKSLPSVADQLKAKEAEKQMKIVSSVVGDLMRKITFYGDESEVAAVKQNLLSQGVTNLNSGLARQAIALAGDYDLLKARTEAQEKYNDKIKDLSEQLDQMRGDAEFEIRFPNPTELNRFERWVKENAQGFDQLSTKINATAQALNNQALFRGIFARNAAAASVIKSLNDQINDARSGPLDDFTSSLKELARTLGLTGYKQFGTSLDETDSVFASKVKGFVTAIEAARDGGIPAMLAVEEAFKNFLMSFTKDVDGKTIPAIALNQIDTLLASLKLLPAALDEAARKSADALGADLLGDLNAEIQELNVQLGLSAEVSKADTIAKLLQTEAYAKLDKGTRDLLQARAAEYDQLKAAAKAQEEAKKQYDATFNTIREGLEALQGGAGNFFNWMMNRFRQFLMDMLAQWLTSKFLKTMGQSGGILGVLMNGGKAAAGAAGGGMGVGGTPNFNPAAGGIGASIFNQNAGQTGSINSNGEYVVNGGGGGGLFGGGRQLFQGGLSTGIGIASAGAGIVGGIVGGTAGNIISMAGTGLGLGFMVGGPVGAAIGAAIGAGVGVLMRVFGGDPKRKRDKNEKMPQLTQGFTDSLAQLRQLIGDVRSLRVSPDSALAKATELRAAIASGFGLNFESKKYRNLAQQQITQRLAEADALIAELRNVADVSRAAGERERRLLPEFAGGVFMSPAFQAFRRRNGMLGGAWTGRDSIPAMLAPGEMVLNPMQQNNVRANAGRDVFANAGIPGYAGGGMAGSQPSSGPMNLNVTVYVEQDADGIWHAAAQSDSGQKVIANVVEKKYANDELKLKRR